MALGGVLPLCLHPSRPLLPLLVDEQPNSEHGRQKGPEQVGRELRRKGLAETFLAQAGDRYPERPDDERDNPRP